MQIICTIITYQSNEEKAGRKVPLELRILAEGDQRVRNVLVPWKIAVEIVKPKSRRTVAKMFTAEMPEEGVPENIEEIVKAYNEGMGWLKMERRFGMTEHALRDYLEDAAKGFEVKYRRPNAKHSFDKF